MRVAVLALDGVVLGDLAIPCEVFGRATGPEGAALYDVRVVSRRPRVHSRLLALDVSHRLSDLDWAELVVVPGVEDLGSLPPTSVLRAIKRASARGATVASICTGAFVLAATGLLDGQRVTTHWRACDALTKAFPALNVDPNVLYVDNGHILTSAGAAAGMDLCLHLVRRYHGARAGADAARLSVMAPERAGGQAQFVVPVAPPDSGSLAPLLQWIEEHIDQDLSLERLAHQCAMSVRSMTRRFRQQVGESPGQWVIAARVRRAQELLETTHLSMEETAAAAGFSTPALLRVHFGRLLGTTPTSYRATFQKPRHS